MLKQTPCMILSLLMEALLPGGPCCWTLSPLGAFAPGSSWMLLLLEALVLGGTCCLVLSLLEAHAPVFSPATGCCRGS